MNKNDYMTVTITGEELIRYKQTVQMPKSEYERLSSMLNSDNRQESLRAEEQIGSYIDRHDVFDSDDFEVEDFEVYQEVATA